MPDNWAYVIAAYAVAGAAVGGYWWRLTYRRRLLAERAQARGGKRR